MAENRAAAFQRPRASSAGGVPPKDAKFARNPDNVPLYLQKVKNAIADEERAVAEALRLGRNVDGVPPGHRLLSEDERREILAGLEKRKADLDAQHSRMPLQARTEGQKQRAHELEKACREVEQDIGRFSRPRVLLRL